MTMIWADFAKVLAIPKGIARGAAYRLAGFIYTARPRFICFPVTFRCNARCQMCNIWAKSEHSKELDLTAIEQWFLAYALDLMKRDLKLRFGR